MKKLVPEFEFSPAERERIEELARRLDLSVTTVSILFARGQDDEEKIGRFLHPSKAHFLSPYLMRGMKEAAELLTRARDEEWRVAVFGDYDADGIGALAIMDRALKKFGIEPYLYVPERSQGYGMSVKAIDEIFDEFMPDLFVTVDCGISCAQEVEYIRECGAEVIVTDHHELPEVLPDCIIVNPKLADDYPYDNLCGAGVAFKLATALIGEAANELLDFCALSTVADSVSLLGENRDIVAEGLKLFARPRSAFRVLLGKTSEVTAQTLAFTIAPRLNAAGRMGDARAALALFTSDDEEEIERLGALLNEYNLKRQKLCDELYLQAKRTVLEEGAYDNVIMLSGDWSSGFVGIAAARLADEFARPALLFVRNGDIYKGSARSIGEVNIYEAIKGCSEYLEEFGGHAQAAGVSVRAENFGKLKSALNEYIGKHYRREELDELIPVCESRGFDLRLARELNMLEPFGMCNRRPQFACTAGRLDAALLKPGSPHVSFALGGMEMMCFGGEKQLRLLRSPVRKTVVFEYNLSVFRGKEYLKGFVRSLLCEESAAPLEAFENELYALKGEALPAEETGAEALDGLIGQKRAECAYGLAVLYYDKESVVRYPSAAGLPVEAFRPSSESCVNTLIYAPDAGGDLTAFRDVVYLDRPCAVTQKTRSKPVVGDLCGYSALYGIDTSREELLGVYAVIKRMGTVAGGSLAEAAENVNGVGRETALFALAVFEELGLVVREAGGYRVAAGVKTDLKNSRIYCGARKLAGEE